MGYVTMLGHCINCARPITFNPVKVPSLEYRGAREPLCKACFERWNEIHRTSKGLEPIPHHPEAYSACDEREL